MAGITTKIEDRSLTRRVNALKGAIADMSPLMKVVGEIANTSIQRNFEVGGRPTKWVPLSKVTIAMKGHARPLIGRTGNLARVTVKPLTASVLVGTSPAARDYAAIQQFGGMAGRNRKVRIHARPFILLQAEDKTEMAAEERLYFKRAGA
jgi:phage virion morphogenesis protein